jgi:hypothetical protein
MTPPITCCTSPSWTHIIIKGVVCMLRAGCSHGSLPALPDKVGSHGWDGTCHYSDAFSPAGAPCTAECAVPEVSVEVKCEAGGSFAILQGSCPVSGGPQPHSMVTCCTVRLTAHVKLALRQIAATIATGGLATLGCQPELPSDGCAHACTPFVMLSAA